MAVQGTIVRRPWVATVASLSLVAIGLVGMKVCILDVLDAARRHEASISYSAKAIVLCPAALFLGVVATIASFTKGDPDRRVAKLFSDPNTRKLTPLGWLVVVGLLAIGGGIFLYVRSEIASYGYDV